MLLNEIFTFSGFMEGIQKEMGEGAVGDTAQERSLHVELELFEMLVI